MNIDNSRVNDLAIRYSRTGDESLLKELLVVLSGAIKYKAYKYSKNVHMEPDDIESLLKLAVWEAIKDGKIAHHDTAQSDVMQRINTYWLYVLKRQQRLEDESRHKVNVTAVHIADVFTPEDGTDAENWGDRIRDTAEDFTEVHAAQDVMDRYAAQNPEDFPVIVALAQGVDTQTLATLVGLPEYNACARKRISRIRDRFRDYIAAIA
jgi:hypothetical protein